MAEPDKSRLVLGTAGHIDHGKTSLVKALTGVDTDRLKEEKARGITIELGFATLTLPGGRVLSVVDVPGHERFVRNMVAGASGIDAVLFVVAADEGVMPQTREHLEICSLLGIRKGIVALTKIDMVDEEFYLLVRDDLESFLKGTFLEDAPIVPVSAVTGQGVEELTRRLDELAAALSARDAKGLFRLPVDRVFTIKGFGTVVTGTIASGSVKKDDEVELLPGAARAKVRGIEVHGQAVEKAYAGNRAALNFTGVGVDDIARGDVVVHPESLTPSRMADVRLELLSSVSKPLRNRTRLRLHLGTREVPVVAALLDRDALEPGAFAYVQLRSAEPFVACPGDRFVLRAYSPARTVGGGKLLDPAPARHKGRRPEVIETLGVLDKGETADRLAAFLTLRAAAGLTPAEAQALLSVTLEQSRNLLQAAVRAGIAKVADRKTQRHVASAFVESLATRALDLLAAFHAAHPLKKGLGIEELRTKFPSHVDARLTAFTLEEMEREGRVVLSGDTVRSASFTAALSADDEKLRGDILGFLDRRGFEAPNADELAQAVGHEAPALRPVLEFLASEGHLVRTKEGFYFRAQLLDELAEKIIDLLAQKGEIGVADLKDLTGATRKYAIPLLEYLDSRKITMRKGDARVAGPKGRRQ